MTCTKFSNSPSNHRILCSYKNQTAQLQVLRIPPSQTGYFERVIFPAQHLFFEAEAQEHLEIYYSVCDDSIEMKQIPCISLKVNEIL
ncbi:MAG: DUF1830 domain-containing protein [Cyanobacteriota bacterium]|nr:DUF1830 domain-containing protein [Cyanobacteriota bacterium]